MMHEIHIYLILAKCFFRIIMATARASDASMAAALAATTKESLSSSGSGPATKKPKLEDGNGLGASSDDNHDALAYAAFKK